MKLLHTLQEKCGIHAEGKDFLQISNIVVQERELADWKRIHWFLWVLVPDFGAKIVDLDHGAVVILQKVDYVGLFISVETLKTFRWESTRNYTIGNIGQIKIIVTSELPNDDVFLIMNIFDIFQRSREKNYNSY